jgi:ABC-type proline/glycine betaine transport system permease subunit
MQVAVFCSVIVLCNKLGLKVFTFAMCILVQSFGTWDDLTTGIWKVSLHSLVMCVYLLGSL